MVDSLGTWSPNDPGSANDDLDAQVDAWWASDPNWIPIADYHGGDVLFCTADRACLFYGRREGGKTIQIADNEFVDESLENPWSGPAPVAFTEVPEAVAIVYMMQ